MEALQLLSRDEMRMIRGGDPDDCDYGESSNCAARCVNLYGCYLGECSKMFPDPSSDQQSDCYDEVYELGHACINRC